VAAKRILIIDDDKELCEELTESLSYEGYSAKFAEDAVKGEALIRSDRYDIVLLDFKMPVLTGMDILKKLKADNIRKPIFLFSGRPSVEKALKEADLLGMISGVITKPISFEILLQKIKET
jgi:DNA-binding response OmpR family regulator